MIVINFFGGPCSGKSMYAAQLFGHMKSLNLNVELVTEYFKELVWENTAQTTTDYLYVLANQNRRLERLRDKVDFAIVDSPLLLTGYYGKKYGRHPKIIEQLSTDMFDTYDNINFYIERTEQFNENGRVHDYWESKQIDKEIDQLTILKTRIKSFEDCIWSLKNIYNLIN